MRSPVLDKPSKRVLWEDYTIKRSVEIALMPVDARKSVKTWWSSSVWPVLANATQDDQINRYIFLQKHLATRLLSEPCFIWCMYTRYTLENRLDTLLLVDMECFHQRLYRPTRLPDINILSCTSSIRRKHTRYTLPDVASMSSLWPLTVLHSRQPGSPTCRGYQGEGTYSVRIYLLRKGR